MFITVMFGAGHRELVNPWCSLVTLTDHLKHKGQVPPDATIALLAEDGRLISLSEDLEEGTSSASTMGSSLLQERRTYVLVQVIREDGVPTRYVSLLENLDDWYPELAEELHWLSGLPVTGNSRRRRTGNRHGQQDQGTPSRSRRVSSLTSKTH